MIAFYTKVIFKSSLTLGFTDRVCKFVLDDKVLLTIKTTTTRSYRDGLTLRKKNLHM